MNNFKKISNDIYYIGASERRLALFESAYPIPNGISYNSYFVDGEQTVVFDTVDRSVANVYFENLLMLLRGRPLDYVVVTHMEPDHSAMLGDLLQKYPTAKVICNAKTKAFIAQFGFWADDERFVLVNEGDSLTIGNHTYTFIMAPMVHWPEVMVVYDNTSEILYSADAFGTFGALSGNIFDDEIGFSEKLLNETRRYYTNIVGKYGPQVSALLKKAAGLSIKMICPLHGPIIRSEIATLINKYAKWSSYTPEDNDVLIAYASIYGNTENAAQILAKELGELGVKTVMYDTSVTHYSEILAEAFRVGHIVLAAPTYNNGIFTSMELLISDLKNHNLQNRTFAFIENGSWSPVSGKLMKESISTLKNSTIIENTVTIKSTLKYPETEQLKQLAADIKESMPKADELKIDPTAMFKLSYGLFVISANDGTRDNGCIINTVTQVTDIPKRITFTINKANLTHDLIIKTGKANISVLDESAPFSIFETFGFKSGRTADKFSEIDFKQTAENGIAYLTNYTCALISVNVIKTRDLSTHTEFLADVTEARLIGDGKAMTYQYYFDNVKPKPQAEKKKGFVCKICGYVYEGDTLPEDFICPLCKHPASDFEPI